MPPTITNDLEAGIVLDFLERMARNITLGRGTTRDFGAGDFDFKLDSWRRLRT